MIRRSHSVLWLALALVTVSGCKKKPKTVVAKANAPTITAPVATTPMDPKPAETTPDKAPIVAPEPLKVKTKPKPKPPAPKRIVVKAPPAEPAKSASDTTTIAKSTSSRIVVQPSIPAEGQPNSVVPDMFHTEAAHHRQTTEQLMLSTEANLKSLRRVLNPEERSLLQQIQLFMTQSREASLSQDLVRAHNLALKAHLLSDELVR